MRRTLFALPYRCSDCNDLFWVTRKVLDPVIISLGAIGLIAVMIVGALLWSLKKESAIKDRPPIVFDRPQSQEKAENTEVVVPVQTFEYSWVSQPTLPPTVPTETQH